MAIKFIITHHISRFDINGNRYTKTTILRADDGAQITLDTGWGGPSITGYSDLGCNDWSEVHYTELEDVPIRQWNKIPAVRAEQGATINEMLDSCTQAA